MKLDTEPRLAGLPASLIDWARAVVRAFNGNYDAQSTKDAAQDALIAQATPTGAFMHFMLPSAPAGWIAGNGGTIGNVGSGATRANEDTLALFTAWWAFTDAQLPILTSAGGASTRGASAAADWAALKRLTVFDVRGRFMRNADGGAVIAGTKYAEGLNNHTHTSPFTTFNLGAGGLGISVPSITSGNYDSGSVSGENRPINIGALGCFKL